MPSGNHIRYFDLLPGSWEDPIRGQLSVRLDGEDKSYEAISYTWGSDLTYTVIDCDGNGLDVRANLAILLRRLRSPSDTKRLWVDALCIDQSDEDEQSEQVRRMDSVYRNAGRVVIWLGEENETTAEAFNLLEELRGLIYISPKEQPLSAASTSSISRHRWHALERLLNNSWFSRTWCRVGNSSIRYHGRLRSENKYITSRRSDGLSLYGSFLRLHFIGSASWPLLELLEHTEWTSSSKDIDKVFALIGLANDQQTFKPLINYAHDAPLLYSQVALKYLLNGDMKILNSASDHSFSRYRQLPTWVPDWSTWPRASSLGPQISRLRALDGPHPYKKPTKFPTVSPHGSQLTVSGQFTDRVVAIGRHLPLARCSYRGIAFIFLESWRRLAHRNLGARAHPLMTKDMDVDPHVDPLDDVFARLLTLECPLEHLRSESYLRTYLRFLGQAFEHEDVFKYCDRMLTSCRKRTFFVTEQGFMGLGPYFLRPGDRIVQLDGGWTPMAVRRKRAGCFELVGEAYVPGLMRGGWEGDAVYEDICLV
ncbi:hypothetical protein LTR59_009714 [Friedmanniomyces endolithicus]|nr:hypothetical protein LTR94_014679 [Friedmanniomyces endolithicus]KAK0783972.1 hypothetical protein LTR38_012833 [Friedmanniomyces endolithicus]KAK0789285.1 hypothetical protein LTR59_009714 [Friedmanniomyces endolithicus]